MIKQTFLKIIDWLIKPRSIGAIFLLVVTFLGINYLVFSILSPLKAISTINHSIVMQEKSDKIPEISNQEINNLYREKAFYESKLALAKSDSLVLSVNFPDSLLTIEIKGIPIHTISLTRFRNTSFFSLIKNDPFQQIYSLPQRIINSQATAEKEPIKIVNAPKDTNEYNASGNNTNYDTSVVKLTFVEYETNQGFRMIFIPIEERNFHNWRTEFKFTSKLIWRNFKTSFRSSVQFKVPEFHPTVYIYLSQDDILSMHRALPEHAEVCIHY